jgi:ferredoxin
VRWLKKIRVAVAVLCVLPLSFLFLDFGAVLPSGVQSVLVSTQVIPSLIRTVVFFSAASIGLFSVVLLTFLFGRVYCSTICPLGILQDVSIRIAKKMNRRRRFKFKKQFYSIHYGLFFVAALSAVMGSLILVNIFEPFSNYGRILSNVVSPFIVIVNNTLGYILGLFGFMFLFQIPLLHVNTLSVIASFGFLGLVLYLSYNHGRLFCNLLCPAGALLGLVSRFSVFKIVIDENNCKECGLCERVCKAGCINSKSMQIDFAACIGCFNCIDGCPTVGMSYQGRWKKTKNILPIVHEGRRTALKTAIMPTLGLLLPDAGKDSIAAANIMEFDEIHRHPISPPGSISVEQFSNRCTACHLCISSCPTQVLFPSFLEYGIAGIFQPKMNYAASYCNFDCVICSQVCPTGAILPIDTVKKKQVQIGKVRFVKEDCVVVSKKKDCGACSEHCPTKAVKMVPYEQKLVVPEVNDELCVGCGACEHACPVQPRKAIYVKSNLVHGTAKKPKTDKLEPSFDSKQDFPF